MECKQSNDLYPKDFTEQLKKEANEIKEFVEAETEREAEEKVDTYVNEVESAINGDLKEGDRERIQVYEGVCIARKNDGLNSSFTVRKISFGEGVERVFPLYSPNVAKIEVSRIGKVRRAKLYFLRALRGRSARIADDLSAAAKAREEAKSE